MRSLIIALTLLLAISAGAQKISWKTSGSTLPRAQYSLHVSRDGELYAYSQAPKQAAYRFSASVRDWRLVREGAFTKLQVISPELAFTVEQTGLGSNLTVFTENFTKALTLKDNVFGEALPVRDYAIGPDSSIYLIPGDRNMVFHMKDPTNDWDSLPAAVGRFFSGIEVDEHNAVYVWNSDVFRSTDGGVNLENVHLFHPGEVIARCKKFGESLLVLANSGVLYSDGDSLAALPAPGTFTIRDGSLLEVGRDSALFYHPPSGRPLYSLDGGHRWDTLRINGKALPANTSIAIDSQGTVYAAPFFEEEMDYIYASPDNGESWVPLTQLIDYFRLVGAGPDSAIYGIDRTGFYTSTNDGLWWKPDSMPEVRKIYSTSMGADGEAFIVCRDFINNVVIGTKAGYGIPWSYSSPTPQQDAITPYLASGRFPSGELWAVDEEGFFSLLEADGSWRNSSVLDVPGNGIRTAAVVDSTSIIVAGFEEIYLSSNKGKTFRKVFSLRTDETVVAITSNFTTSYLITDDDRILHSTDKGQTWELFVTPSTDQHTDIVVTPSGAIFLSTTKGVFMNASGFNNPFVWEDVSGVLKDLPITRLSPRGTQRLYAATPTGNVYYTDLPGASVAKAATTNALQAYPNPARERCYLDGVAESAEVEIYDLLGIRVLHTLYRGKVDVSGLPSGMYQIVVRGSTLVTALVISR